MRVAYFGYDFFFGCLEDLVDAKHEVLAVFTFPTDNKYNYNANILRIASSIGSPIFLHRPTATDIAALVARGCDLIVSAAYPYRIPMLASLRGINIHPTLLPHGRGPWPLPRLIYSNSQHAGVTIHQLATDFDSGPILLQEPIAMSERETLESLSAKLQLSARPLLQQCVAKVDALWSLARPQGEGSYWPMPSDEEQSISWTDPVRDIERKVRAFGKFDTNALIDGKKYFVHDVSVWACPHVYTPGATVHRMNREVVVAAADGLVCVRFSELA